MRRAVIINTEQNQLKIKKIKKIKMAEIKFSKCILRIVEGVE